MGFFMAEKTKSKRNNSIIIPDAALADLDIAAERAREAADRKREAARRKRKAAKTADSCATCRTGDWKAADGRYCKKRRIELDPKKPIFDCKYWRAPLPN